VEGRNYIGIYLRKDSATVVCLGSQGQKPKLLQCFTVELDQEQSTGADMAQLAQLIAEKCNEQIPSFRDCEVTVALDCGLFMQHSVHSEFTDIKQIAQTIRFDAEEALSTDVSDVALAFKVVSTDESGSQLVVFTAERQVLSEILLSLQNNGIDPVSVDPDVNSLTRHIQKNVSLPQDVNSIVGLLSKKSGYLICLSQSQNIPTMRTFLIGAKQNRNDVLARQIPLTMASAGTDDMDRRLMVLDYVDSVNARQLGERLAVETSPIELLEALEAQPQTLDDCDDHVALAVACGAAIAHAEKASVANFRDDFMPFQGKKRRMEKTLKLLSISVTILLLALGTYVTAQLMQMNKYRGILYDKFKPDYVDMMSKRSNPKKISIGAKKLESKLRAIKAKKKGVLADDESVASKLSLVLDAFNKTAKTTQLSVDSINITSREITIKGETRKRSSTLRLIDALKANLEVLRYSFKPVRSGRESFSLSATPKGANATTQRRGKQR
jgi:hypothetical protein